MWGSCFSLGTRRAASASARRRVPHSSQHYSSHLTHHSTTHHTSLITALPITPHSSHLTHHSTIHHTTCQSHHAVVWQAQYTEPPGEAAARVGAAGPRPAFVWQAQYAPPSGGAAARVVAGWPAWPAAGFRVAGAVRAAVGRSCCARGRRLARVARGWLSCGRRITQSLRRSCCARGRRLARMACGWLSCGKRVIQSLEELLRAWSPAAGVRVAGAVHRAFWRSCCARGRLLAS